MLRHILYKKKGISNVLKYYRIKGKTDMSDNQTLKNSLLTDPLLNHIPVFWVYFKRKENDHKEILK